MILQTKAQPDITSGPEVRQIFQIRTVRKPDVFLPGRRTFSNRKNSKNSKKNFQNFFSNFFHNFFLFICMVKCLKIYVRIQSGPAGPVRQIWVSGPVRSGNSYAQSGRALLQTQRKTNATEIETHTRKSNDAVKNKSNHLLWKLDKWTWNQTITGKNILFLNCLVGFLIPIVFFNLNLKFELF